MLEGDLVMANEVASNVRQTSKERAASVKHLTSEDIASNKFALVCFVLSYESRYSITDVVLPLPGNSVVYPKNEMERLYHEIAERDGVSLTESSHKVKEFSIEKLTGDYRKIIIKPEEFEYSFVTYKNSYEPLLLSDIEKLNSQDSGLDSVNDVNPRKRKAEDVRETQKRTKTEDEDEETIQKTALKMKFKLPPSSYATMLVRQLTKQSTSKIDQINITNDDNP